MSILQEILSVGKYSRTFIHEIEESSVLDGEYELDFETKERIRIANAVESPLQAYARYLSRLEITSPKEADKLRINYPVTGLVYADIVYAKLTWKNRIWMINGPTGSGKSLSGLSLSHWLDPSFDVREQIFWKQDKLLNYVRYYAKAGCCCTLDEEITRQGVGAWGIQRAMENLEATVRYAELNFLFIYVMERPHKCHTVFYTRGEHYIIVPEDHPLRAKGKALGADYFVLGVLQPFAGIQNSYQLLGLMTVDVPPQWEIMEYEKDKAEFVNAMVSSGGFGPEKNILDDYGWVFDELKNDDVFFGFTKDKERVSHMSYKYSIQVNIAEYLVGFMRQRGLI